MTMCAVHGLRLCPRYVGGEVPEGDSTFSNFDAVQFFSKFFGVIALLLVCCKFIR